MLRAIFFVEKWWNRWIPFIRKLKANPKILLNFNMDKDDPNDYTSLISILRFGSTSKTTLNNRHFQTNEFLANFSSNKHMRILDVGASDGVTSMNFMQTLNHEFEQFYITDYNLNANYIKQGGMHYLFDVHTNECVLAFNNNFVFKPNISKFIGGLFGHKIKALQKKKAQFKRITLLHPEVFALLNSKPNISALEYNIFEDWKHEKVDIIKVANLLNRVYFSDQQILQGIHKIKEALNDHGILAIIHNFGEEKVSIYRKEASKLLPIHEINGGVEIKNLVVSDKLVTS